MALDPDAKNMLDAIAAAGIPDLHSLPPEVARAGVLDGLVENDNALPMSKIENKIIPGPAGDLPIRIYTPKSDKSILPITVYFHGGGYVICNLDTHDDCARGISQESESIVVSVDYRLAPENKFPAAPDDCLAATRWAAEHAREFGGDATRMAVAGDSAGGNLATVVAMRIRDEGGPKLAAQLLIYPITDYYDSNHPSYTENGDGYFLTKELMIWFHDLYLNNVEEANNPHASPLRSKDLTHLPPAFVLTCEFDPLKDEGQLYAQKLIESGVDVQSSYYQGMIHSFYGNTIVFKRAVDALQETGAWLKSKLA